MKDTLDFSKNARTSYIMQHSLRVLHVYLKNKLKKIQQDLHTINPNVFPKTFIFQVFSLRWLETLLISQPAGFHSCVLFVVYALQVVTRLRPDTEMTKRRDIVAIVLIVLPWTLLITVWHQNAITPFFAIQKGTSKPLLLIFIIINHIIFVLLPACTVCVSGFYPCWSNAENCSTAQ